VSFKSVVWLKIPAALKKVSPVPEKTGAAGAGKNQLVIHVA
jgi:hypothetical protein